MAAKKLPASFHAEAGRLQSVHTDTRMLANAIATLLWQYGEKPSPQKVLQYAGQGSMATIHDELNKWWDALRERDMVRINNPTVPQELNDMAGRLLGAMWEECMARANASLEDQRKQATILVSVAEDRAQAAEDEALRQKQAAEEATKLREGAEQALAVERAAKDTALAGQEEWRQKAEATNVEMERLRGLHAKELSEARADFTQQLDAMRQSLKDAEFQYNEMRKQNMVEMDAMRTRAIELREATQKAEKALAAAQDNERSLYRQQNELNDKITVLSRKNGELAARLETAQAETTRLKKDSESRHQEQQGLIEMLRKQLEQLMPAAELRELLKGINQ